MNARKLSPAMGSVDLAEIRARYIGARLPATVAADMEALRMDLDRTRFALAGTEGKLERVLEEKAELEKRMYVLLATRPGAGMAV
jgi:hypothetical protein